MMSDETPKEVADQLLEFVNRGKEVFDIFHSKFRKQHIIAGATIEQWESKFKVKITPDLGVQECKEIDKQLMEKYQEASFYKAVASAAARALESGSEAEYRKKLNLLVEDYHEKKWKVPAATTLKSLVENKLSDVHASVLSAQIAEEFWKDIIRHLETCRKIVENITINNGIDAKLTPRGY